MGRMGGKEVIFKGRRDFYLLSTRGLINCKKIPSEDEGIFIRTLHVSM
jgi:hypothetical protein